MAEDSQLSGGRERSAMTIQHLQSKFKVKLKGFTIVAVQDVLGLVSDFLEGRELSLSY